MKLFSNLFGKKTEGGKSSVAVMPEIGKDIKWTDVVSHVFRVIEFDRAGTIIDRNGKVKTKSVFSPYGYLIVESLAFNNHVRLPIVHRDDFLLASSVYDDISVSNTINQNELLVTYIPKDKIKDGLAGITHAIHYVIVPPNTLELYNSKNGKSRNQKPEIIFGSLAWEGEIKVGVNLNPKW